MLRMLTCWHGHSVVSGHDGVMQWRNSETHRPVMSTAAAGRPGPGARVGAAPDGGQASPPWENVPVLKTPRTVPKCGLGPCLQDHHHVASWHAVCTAGVGCPTDWPLGLTKQSFVVNCIIYHSWNCKMLTKYPKYFINLLRTQVFAEWSPNFQI